MTSAEAGSRQVAIVTGAAGSIGAAIARELVAHGISVIATDLRYDAVEALAVQLGEECLPVEHDVSDPDSWDKVMAFADQSFGHVNFLVNNAAYYRPVGLRETTSENWHKHVAVVQYGTFLGLQRAADQDEMIAIVNIVSTVALKGVPGMFAYQAAKSAVRGMSRSAAVELAPRIRVNALFPGLIDTPMAALNGTEVNSALTGRIPLGRMGQPQEIASAVHYLLSPGASFVSGTELLVDGGSQA